MMSTETEFDHAEMEQVRKRIALVIRHSNGEECCRLGPTLDGTQDLKPLMNTYHALDSILRGNSSGLHVAVQRYDVRDEPLAE